MEKERDPKLINAWAVKAMCKSAIRDAAAVQDMEDQLIRLFEDWDRDGNGQLTMDEMSEVFATIGLEMSAKEIEFVFKNMDRDSSGGIAYREMVDYFFRSPFMDRYIEESKVLVTMAVGALPTRKITQRQKQKLQSLLKFSFAYHDKDESGILEKDESIIFITNYAVALASLLLHVSSKLRTKEEQETVHTELMDWLEECKQEPHKFNKRFQKAFAVLDISGDGRLQRQEVIEGLMHGSQKNVQLMQALEVPGYLMYCWNEKSLYD